VRFAKYHGIGNDFLVVDLRDAPEQFEQWATCGVAICDRRFGVGADGILAILPGRAGDARMEVINSDGSIAEMCGNGLRCVVRYLHDRGGLGRDMRIDTNAGVLPCSVDDELITVLLGPPRIERAQIPMVGDGRCIDEPYVIDGVERRITGVSTGNPHLVVFVESAEEARRLAREHGPALEHHEWFPLKANVELAYARSRTAIDVHVWERACGLTLACGTGASATAVAAVLTDRADPGTPIDIHLPGGRLSITVQRDLGNVAMTGTATHVFDGALVGRAPAGQS
jgi:diaminopimelate epimerase